MAGGPAAGNPAAGRAIGQSGRWLPFLFTLLAAALIALWGTDTPAPLPHDAPADQFSAGRAMADVRAMAARPHPTGSAANDAVRAHLTRRLKALGFDVQVQAGPLPPRPAERLAKWGGDPAAGFASLIAVRRAPARDAAGADQRAVAIMAHIDSVWASPGAADDAAGVAAALEIARAIPAASQRRDLVLLLTDAEELGLVGARAFFGDHGPAHPLAARVGLLINLEARGGGGRAMMFETGPNNGETVRLLAGQVRNPAAQSLAVAIYERLPNDTDFTPAKTRGVQGMNFAFIGDAWAYHSPLSTPDRLNQGSLQHLGAQALDAVRAALALERLPGPAPDLIFGDALGLGIIAYPVRAGWLLLGAASLLILLAARRRLGQWTLPGASAGAVEALLAALLAGGLLWLFNQASGSAGGEYYDRLAALPRLEVQALLLLLAVLVAAAMMPRQPLDRWLGAATLTWVLALTVQTWLPGAGPLFAWPLLLAAAGLGWAGRRRTTAPLDGSDLLLAAPGAVIGLALLGALGHFAMLGVGPMLPMVLAPLLVPALALLAPLLPGDRPRRARLAVAALLLAALAMALWVRLDPVAPSVPPYAGTEKG